MSVRLVSASGDLKVSAWTWARYTSWWLRPRFCPRARLGEGERLLADGTVTDVPDDGTFYRDDLTKNYSVRRETLVRIIDFLRSATGPVRVD
jgi:hypothetical protein